MCPLIRTASPGTMEVQPVVLTPVHLAIIAGGGAQILRQPLPKDKLRPGYLNAENRRKQR